MFPRIQPSGSDESSSLGNVYSRQATESVNCENSSVCSVSCAGISIEGVGVIINKSAGAKSGSDCSVATSLPVLVRQLLYSSHKSETAP